MIKLYEREIWKDRQLIAKDIIPLDSSKFEDRKLWEECNAIENNCRAFMYELKLDGYNIIVNKEGNTIKYKLECECDDEC